ncbi:hypothetical protein [Prevotella intermedia]|nr:hypothetical protein [Prevotella intermedia]
MNENATLLKDECPPRRCFIPFASLLVGFLAVIGGQQVARIF